MIASMTDLFETLELRTAMSYVAMYISGIENLICIQCRY